MYHPEQPGRPAWPESGQWPPSGMPGPPEPGTNVLAVAALVLAVGNVVFGSFLGFFLPLVPAAVSLLVVILGHLSLAQIRRRGEDGRAVALAALGIGYLCLAGVLAILALMFTFSAVGMALLGF